MVRRAERVTISLMKCMVVDAVKDTWELGCKLKEILAVLGAEFKMLKKVIEHGIGACIYRQDQLPVTNAVAAPLVCACFKFNL